MLKLILYSKPGCHLCEGLQEKLAQISDPALELEVRNITDREDWFAAYQYEIPMLYRVTDTGQTELIPRPSPRASVDNLRRLLQKLTD